MFGVSNSFVSQYMSKQEATALAQAINAAFSVVPGYVSPDVARVRQDATEMPGEDWFVWIASVHSSLDAHLLED
jgi:hypothetical protein